MKTKLKVTAHYKSRTFTIKRKIGGKTVLKHRTKKLNKLCFRIGLTNTKKDWNEFLDFIYEL